MPDIITWVVVGAMLLGGQYSRAQSSSRFPVFRARAELVVVPVVVRKNGNHVAGLRRETFTILEDGSPQRIASFEEVSGVDDARQRKQASPGVYTNSLAGDEPSAHLSVFLLDEVNTPFIKQWFAREALRRFVASMPDTGSPMMLAVLLPSGLKVLHGFTSDPAVLQSAIRRTRSALTGQESADAVRLREQAAEAASSRSAAESQRHAEGDPAPVDELAEMIYRIPEYLQDMGEIDRNDLTLGVMQQLAHALAGVPGRKSLIWATGGISYLNRPQAGYGLSGNPRAPSRGLPPTRMEESNELFDKTWRLLSDANVAVYPVDLTEVMDSEFGSEDRNSMSSFSGSLWGPRRSVRHSQVMIGFTERTGGAYCELQSKLENCFRRAMEESERYYLLSYYASAKGKQGWRKLQIKVAEPGVHIQARSGYVFQIGDQPAAEAKAEMAQALVSPLDATGIRLTVQWLNVAPVSGKSSRKAVFQIFIDPDTVAFDGAEQNHFHLKLTAAARSATGVVGDLAKTIEGTPAKDALAKLQERGLFYRDVLEVPAGTDEVRFVIRDEISGRLGSVTAPMQ